MSHNPIPGRGKSDHDPWIPRTVQYVGWTLESGRRLTSTVVSCLVLRQQGARRHPSSFNLRPTRPSDCLEAGAMCIVHGMGMRSSSQPFRGVVLFGDARRDRVLGSQERIARPFPAALSFRRSYCCAGIMCNR
jgi:hypothetical protein